jgi:hypothetical protein
MLAGVSGSPNPRASDIRALICATLVVALLSFGYGAAPAAHAAGFENGSALNQLDEAPAEETTPTATTPGTAETTNSKSVVLLAAAGAIVLLCAIAFVIARDARKVAPAGGADVGDPRPAHDPRVTLEKRRAKAKAARKQRKRNR